MKDLLVIRDEIDEIDQKIVELYEKRMDLVTEVADFKIVTGKPVFDSVREQQKLKKVSELASTEFTKHGIHELYEHIMSISRTREYQLLVEHGQFAPTGFIEVKELDFSNAACACIDQSKAAAMNYFKGECGILLCDSWKDACDTLQMGAVNYLFLPIMDIGSGYVSGNYNFIAEYGFYILEEVKTSDDPKDRYLLISKDKIALSGADKISICFEAPDECGSIYHLMSHLTYNNLNMNRIESVVISRNPLDYRFYMDLSGNLNDSNVKNAILGLGEEAVNFKILGNYR